MTDNPQPFDGISLREEFCPSWSYYAGEGGGFTRIRALRWDPDGQSLIADGSQTIFNWEMAVGEAHYRVKWNTETGSATGSACDEHTENEFQALTEMQSPNGQYQVTLREGKIALRFSTERTVHLATVESITRQQIAFSNDSRLLIGVIDGRISIWRSDTGKLITTFAESWFELLAVNPQRSCFATALAFGDVVEVWDLNIDKILETDNFLSSLSGLKDADILKMGPDTWNFWKRQTNVRKLNFSRENLSQQNLSGADLSSASFFAAKLRRSTLKNADLRDADLSYADLREADLSGANLTGAKLVEAFLTGAKLDHANLTRANLVKAELTGVEFKKANFTEAQLGWTVFGNNDLAEVQGLETVRHEGPSDIGLNTLYSSKGNLPALFLRGCGFPQSFIDSLPALLSATDVSQFYSCFISYSHEDEEFARQLHARLREANIRVWFAPEDVNSGMKLYEQISDAILKHDRLLIVLSEQSLKSQWVMTEIRKARQTEIRDNRRKLFPIRLVDFETIQKWECFDADTGKDLAVEMREYFIPDFSGWRSSTDFENAFKRLLKDLRLAERN